MNGGKPFRSSSGYTIVELMIVLAVSGVLFLIATNFISGKQEKTSFQQGSNQVATDIQSVIEDVADGHFTDIPIHCALGGPGNSLNIDGSGAGTQGTNAPCVFLGKMIFFNADNSCAKYRIFTLAGDRTATKLANSSLTAIDAPAQGGNPAVNLTKTFFLPNGLCVQPTRSRIKDSMGGNHPNGGEALDIGFLQGLGTVDLGGNYQSGTQTIGMVEEPIAGLSEDSTASFINMTTPITATSASICISDGVRYASLEIGTALSNNNQLHVILKQYGETPCP